MSKTVTINSKAEKQDKPTIVKDESGYYKVYLGAFNTYNHAGIYYRCPLSFLDFLQSDKSILGRRLRNGILRAEYKHPDYSVFNNLDPRTKALKIKQRTIEINLDRVCAHIKTVNFHVLDKKENGWDLPIIIVEGWVKPAGPFKKELQEALENPNENTTFSVRSLVRERVVGSTLVRDLVDISTWDYVFEPGIKIASQWNAAGIEHRTSDSDIAICVNGMCNLELAKLTEALEDVKDIVATYTIEDDKDVLDMW